LAITHHNLLEELLDNLSLVQDIFKRLLEETAMSDVRMFVDEGLSHSSYVTILCRHGAP
jgi:hypothetical protein